MAAAEGAVAASAAFPGLPFLFPEARKFSASVHVCA